ncbi:YsnF/AvaK domain-containing protein [Rhodococcus kroppenstedtii]|uniref:Unannotated protein n=1 Tax=freshwater metagenome TaxID=449393 RepID=A0A6J7F941_9ZZZZ|nr:YsnF/AvaK domain-containing protein [Rhodococcus kroppenstedtii]MDV7199408.1 YsnF/AvaK domain-containing protein [Rhodococcus kroppenstedtii]MSX06322.1 DUF2382 domain-containing protein [Actinomycetota bacterium]
MTAPGPLASLSVPPPGSTVVGSDGTVVGRVASVDTQFIDTSSWVAVTLAESGLAVLAPLSGARRTSTGIAVAVEASIVRGAPPVTDPETATAGARNYYRRHVGADERAASSGVPDADVADRDREPGDGTASTSDATTTRSREDLVVGTEWVPYRRMRLRKRVVTEERTVTVTVRREELVVEVSDITAEDPVSGARPPRSRSDEAQPRHDDVIEMTLHAEEPVVGIEVVAAERVRARMIVVDGRPVAVTDTVRREEIDIERQ